MFFEKWSRTRVRECVLVASFPSNAEQCRIFFHEVLYNDLYLHIQHLGAIVHSKNDCPDANYSCSENETAGNEFRFTFFGS